MVKNKQLLFYTFGPIVGGVLQLVSIYFLSWAYESQYVGMLSLILVSTTLSLLFLTLGLDQALAREFHHIKDKTSLFIHAIIPGLFILLLIFFILQSISPELISNLLFDIKSRQISLFIAFSILFEFLNRFLTLQLRMFEDALGYSISQIVPRLFFLYWFFFFTFLTSQGIFTIWL